MIMASFTDIIQFVTLIALLVTSIKPLGSYMARVYQGERTLLSPLLLPLERFIYRMSGVDGKAEMEWKRYATAMILFNLALFVALVALLLGQHLLPLNPQNLPPFSWHLALNTAISFVTNTNWQNYAGEQAASSWTSSRWGSRS